MAKLDGAVLGTRFRSEKRLRSSRRSPELWVDAYDKALAERWVDSSKAELIAARAWRSSAKL